MLNSIFFLSDNYDHFSNELFRDDQNRVYPSFFSDHADENKTGGAYRHFSENEIRNFSISIRLNSSPANAYLQHIMSFFFIPGNYNNNNQRVVNLVCTENGLFLETKKKMQQFSLDQGIENLRINQLIPYKKPADAGAFAQEPVNYLFSNPADLAIYCSQAIHPANIYNREFYISVPPEEISNIYWLIRAAEDELKKQNTLACRLAGENQSIKVENALLEKKYQSVLNELNNYKAHIEVMRSSHQAKELQDYYDNEYEMLPLWYKRLGHIVKVIMGKRHLRSLFNDNVKKYKN